MQIRSFLGIIGLCATPLAVHATVHETCEASWYGPELHGNLMANGRPFNMNDATVVAHRTLPLGTHVRVSVPETGRSIDLVVQDRGPYIAGRCVDLSRAAAQELGFYCGPNCGTANVTVEIIE